MKKLKAHAERHGGWWALSIDVGARTICTQCRRLDQAEAVAREAVSMALDVPLEELSVALDVKLDGDVGSIVEATLSASIEAARAQATASERSRQAVRDLRRRGYTVRDCAQLLGISPARVSQLLAG